MKLVLEWTNKASCIRKNPKVLLEKRFKVCFLLFSLWFMTNIVSTNSQYLDEFGLDYVRHKNQKLTVVNDLRTVTMARVDCRERLHGRLLALGDDKRKTEVLSNFMRNLEDSK